MVFGGLIVSGVVLNETLTNELITVDFRDEADPFEVGENSFFRGDLFEGTYRITVKSAAANTNSSVTSLGDFVRTAYAVGIRAEVVEMTEPGTAVAAMCLGPATEGAEGLVGYGFWVEPGGDFVLGRQIPDGSLELLEQGEDTRIETVKRVSIQCVPNEIDPAFGGSTDVTVTGYANGLEIVTTQDSDGYRTYTHAGLTVGAEQAGTEVRFTRALARVPDQQWMP